MKDVVGIIIFFGVLVTLLVIAFRFWLDDRDKEIDHKPMAREISKPLNIEPSPLRWLPTAFYVIAYCGFAGWIIIAVDRESWEAFGFGIGSMIACLGSGRVIELLQNIDDKLE